MNIRPEISPGRAGAWADPTHEAAASSDLTTIRQAPGRGRPGSRSSTKRWLAAALAALFMPKCVVCIAGYVATGGVALELCGGVNNDGPAAWWAGVAGGALILTIGAWMGQRKPGSVSGPDCSTR
jgi:hypothetical protein